MNRIIAFGLMLLLVFACQEEPQEQQNNYLGQTSQESFNLNGSLGVVELDDELRAGLVFNGVNAVATSKIDLEDFQDGANKINARWGIVYKKQNESQLSFEGQNCEKAVANKPNSQPSVNTVYFKSNKAKSIEGAELAMYCQTTQKLSSIKSAWMCLDGAEGTGVTGATKQYFDAAHNTDPNDRIEAIVGTGKLQKGRHIPIMTDVEPFENFKNNTVKFSPRGTLISLCLKNKSDKDLIITGIAVPKQNVFSFSGYFDWSRGTKPQFFSTDQFDAQDRRIFEVYSSEGLGYELKQGHTETPCFYVWACLNGSNHKTFDLQLRYKTSKDGAEHYTEIFKFKPQNGENFRDGANYQKLLEIELPKDLKLSANSVSVGTPTSKKSNTASVTITSGNGTYSVKSNNPKKAIASVTGNTITITGKGVYSAVVTVTDELTKEQKQINVAIEPRAYGMAKGVTHIKRLDPKVKETSGLIYWNGHLITHNDSGGKPKLYCLNKEGEIVRTITLQGATNRDWEDIAQDEDYIYVGDIGNNVGTLPSFKIYKVSKQAILAKGEGNIIVPVAEILSFPKLDGANAGSGNMKHDWDMESLIVRDGKLSIFTKQWMTQTQTKRFEYNGSKMIKKETLNLDPGFTVTGAEYDEVNNTLFLIGYSTQKIRGKDVPKNARMMIVQNWGKSNESIVKYDIGLKKRVSVFIFSWNIAYQMEAICIDEEGDVYITNDKLYKKGYINIPAQLYKLKF